MPFSKLAYVVGPLIHVAPDADEAALEAARAEVERYLNLTTQRAYALAGADLKRATPVRPDDRDGAAGRARSAAQDLPRAP